MSLTIAGVLPHNPILLQKTSAKSTDDIATPPILPHTKIVLENLKTVLREQRIDTVVMLSTQTPRLPMAFGINYALKTIGTLENFGDLSTSISIRCDIDLAQKIKEHSEGKIAIQTFSSDKIDYGLTVPMLLLQNDSHPFKLVSLSMGTAPTDAELLHIGSILAKQIDQSPTRVALLVSMHGSHTNQNDTSLSTTPLTSDEYILKALSTKDTNFLKENNHFIDETLVGRETVLVFLGMLQSKKYQFDEIVYEKQFGIGHITTFTRL